jgi:RNA polymerase sigma factor (sigma-70 family)
MIETSLNMETAYSHLRPLFLRALAQLARQGLAVSPADGMDLIHDFFAERWNHVARNYRAEKGTLRQYAYSSFVYFARPQILRLRRMQGNLVDMDQLDRFAAGDTSEAATDHDQRVLLNAISQLPEFQKSILRGYIYADAPSERTLAKDFGLTRYRLHEALVEALGRVVVLLDRPEGMPERDWHVARALWRDLRTLGEAAGYLGMTTHQVREANSRNMRLLGEALQHYKPKGRHRLRRKTMKTEERRTPECLLKDTLRSAEDSELLRQLTLRASEVLNALENPASFELSDEELRKMSPLRIAEVYDVLSKADGRWQEEDEAEIADLTYAHEDEEFSIGEAYRDCLIPDLPPHLREPEQWLASVERVDRDEREYALSTPSVRGGLPATASLAEFGVTPLMILRAIQAVSYLLERFIRRGRINANADILLTLPVHSNEQSIDPLMLIGEVKRMAECREPTAKALYDWQVQVAEYKPKLFDGFHAEPKDGAVLLTRTEEHFDNLIERWSCPARVFSSLN